MCMSLYEMTLILWSKWWVVSLMKCDSWPFNYVFTKCAIFIFIFRSIMKMDLYSPSWNFTSEQPSQILVSILRIFWCSELELLFCNGIISVVMQEVLAQIKTHIYTDIIMAKGGKSTDALFWEVLNENAEDPSSSSESSQTWSACHWWSGYRCKLAWLCELINQSKHAPLWSLVQSRLVWALIQRTWPNCWWWSWFLQRASDHLSLWCTASQG